MAEWAIFDGQLAIERPHAREIPSADDVFRSVLEGERRWPDLEPGAGGAAAFLIFSRYPAVPFLVLGSDAGRPRLEFVARLPHGGTASLDSAQIRAGHFLAAGTWFPLDPEAAATCHGLATDAGVPDGGELTSLRQILNLKKLGVSALLEDRLSLDAAVVAGLVPQPEGAPERVHATLYPYQTDGWRWLRFVSAEGIGGLLADEMGLGKTLQVISLLSDPGTATATPALIVAPGSLLENWCRELRRFAPDLTVLKHHGPDRTGSPARLDPFDVVVTSYETVVRDSAMMGMRSWAVVILDEAQNIRNPDATRTKAVKRLPRKSGIAVTGTPLENRLLDVWSLIDFVCPGYLGSESEFTGRFVDHADGASALEPIISPLILRRKVSEVALDLPSRIDIPQIVELDPDAAQQYEDLRHSIFTEYGRAASLVALTKLRMFCAHPDLVLDAGSVLDYVKLQRLDELAEEIFATGEKLLVFTSYTQMADVIAARLTRRFGVFSATLDGRLPIDARQPLLDRFAAVTGGGVLVLNPRAGGSGLNITAANHVLHYNPEWNPALEDQASARSHRRGQTRPVTIHRLLVAGTVEEVISERLQRKRELAENAIVGVEGEAEDLADIVDALARSPLTNRAQTK